jgi:hypothetical protein
MDNLFILNQDSAIIQILLDIYLMIKKVLFLFLLRKPYYLYLDKIFSQQINLTVLKLGA